MRYLFSLFLFFLYSYSHAAAPVNPASVPLTLAKDGNTYIYTTLDGKNYSKIPLFTSAGVSENTPILNAETDLPYENKGSKSQKIRLGASIDPKKVAEKAKDAIKAGAAGLASGGGYVALASITCTLLCDAALDALKDWGIDELGVSDGDLFVNAPDLSANTSTGFEYLAAGKWYADSTSACTALIPGMHAQYGKNIEFVRYTQNGSNGECLFNTYYSDGTLNRQPSLTIYWRVSDCPAGSYYDANGVCSSSPPTKQTPLGEYYSGKYTGEGWSHHWAKMTAKVIEEGGNVFTDGTSVGITGPALVPLSVTEKKTGVRLLPNTTTIAPSTYDGPTESGTQTETTTTSAKNIYQSAPLGQNTGPSVKTSTQAQTVTTITNNVTNVTNIVNETTTETDEAPEETVSDSPMPDLPELYEQKYKDGLTGVVTAKIAELKQTPLFQLPNSLMGDLPSSGQCPAWQLDLNFSSWANFGIHSIGADCAIWDFAALIVLISAAILCRALIFGG